MKQSIIRSNVSGTGEFKLPLVRLYPTRYFCWWVSRKKSEAVRASFSGYLLICKKVWTNQKTYEFEEI